MNQQTVLLDVRADIQAGNEPCSRIMAFAKQLNEGDTLQLIAPFEPVPLYEVLGREGFVHEARDLGGGDWEVRFTRNPQAEIAQLPLERAGASSGGCGCGCSAPEVIELDVRRLEPPQPMMRVLELLGTLPDDTTLRARTDRQPLHLLDQLAARGFDADSKEHPDGGYITSIRRR